MRTPRDFKTRALALWLGALCGVFTVAALALQAAGDAPDYAETLLSTAFAIFGLLVALRVPANNLGWLFLSLATFSTFAAVCAAVIPLATGPWQMPGLARAAVLAGGWQWFLSIGLSATFCLLLFPDGHLPSPRWRLPALAAAISIAVGCGMLIAMTVANLELAIGSLDADISGPAWADALLSVAFVVLLLCALASMSSLAVRWRRAGGIARQQLKWFLFGGLVQLLGVAAGFVTSPVATFVQEISMLALPGAAALAIMRYRLYDIDRLISRTLAWALLTVVLGAVYLAGVTVLTSATATVAGDSPFAVAAATLATAAAFGPVRQRTQSAVDRRFNRARYDGARTAEAYRGRLRDQLDLESIAQDLVATARSTVQPTTAAVWLSAPGGHQ